MAKTLKQKDINLLASLEKGAISSTEAKRRKQILIILLGIIIIIAIFAGIFFFNVITLNNQKDKSLAYVEDPQVMITYESAKQQQEASLAMQERADWIESLLSTLDGYPDISASEFAQVFGYAGGRIEIEGIQYDSSTGVLNFTALSDSATGVPIFVAQLRMSGIFSDVTYEGYTNAQEQISNGTTVDLDGNVVENTTILNKFAFNVSCQLKAGE